MLQVLPRIKKKFRKKTYYKENLIFLTAVKKKKPLHLDLGLKGCEEKKPAVRKFITAIKEQLVKFRK